MLLLFCGRRADAQLVEQTRLVVLRAGGNAESARLASNVDRALHRSLADDAGFLGAYFSPTPFEEVQLLAGCSGPTASCLRRVAATLDADWVLVRDLRPDGHGGYRVLLVAQDGTDAPQVHRAQGVVSFTEKDAPERVLPMLVRDVYGRTPVKIAQTEHERKDDARPASRTLRITGWASTLSATALLATGAAMSVKSSQDQREYERTEVMSPADADHALSLQDRAERRHRVATGLYISGATLGVAGITMLLWDALGARDSRNQPAEPWKVSGALLPGGASITVWGALGRRAP